MLLPVALAALLLLAISIVASESHCGHFADFLYGMDCSAVSVMIDFISSHNSSEAFSIVLSDSNLFFTSTAYRAGTLLVSRRRITGSLLVVLNRSLTFAISSWWSDPQSAPGSVLTACIELRQRCWQRKLSIWFRCCPFGAIHMYKRRCGCSNRVFAINKRFSWQHLINRSQASFHFPNPNLPTTGGSFPAPTFALKSPVM